MGILASSRIIVANRLLHVHARMSSGLTCVLRIIGRAPTRLIQPHIIDRVGPLRDLCALVCLSAVFGGQLGNQSSHMGPFHVEGNQSHFQMYAWYILADETLNNEDERHERYLDVPPAVSLHRPRPNSTHGTDRSPKNPSQQLRDQQKTQLGTNCHRR